MSRPFALVTVRTSSSRLPEKCLQPIAEGLECVRVVLRRARLVGCPVILATTDDPSDDRLEVVAREEGASCFRGPARNKIRRWAECFEAHDVSEGLLVDGDDPTFDYRVGARALDLLRDGRW